MLRPKSWVEKWVKIPSFKNVDTLVASEDNRMLNDIYFEELPDFRLGARPRAPRRAAAAPSQVEELVEHDEPLVSETPPISEGLMQQILSEICSLSLQQ